MSIHELITLWAAYSAIAEIAGLTPPEAAFGELLISKMCFNPDVLIILLLIILHNIADD